MFFMNVKEAKSLFRKRKKKLIGILHHVPTVQSVPLPKVLRKSPRHLLVMIFHTICVKKLNAEVGILKNRFFLLLKFKISLINNFVCIAVIIEMH